MLDDMSWYARLGLSLIGGIDDVDEEISLLDSDHGDDFAFTVNEANREV